MLVRVHPSLLLVTLCLAGCSGLQAPVSTNVSPAASVTLAGRVHGGQQPVSGSTIQLYAVGTSGDYGTATALLSTAATTDANGAFSITGAYSCGSATQVYLLATGGNPGLSASNPNLAMMAALGPCSSLTATTFVQVNELSTVAAVSAIAPFMHSPTAVGSSAYDAAPLASDFAAATELVSLSTGYAPGGGVPSGYSSPATLIDTLGNILAACVNSSGGTAGDGTACGTLFALATPPNGTAPTDTVTAMLNVSNHPTLNTTQLTALSAPSAPFQPSLSAAPSSFHVALQAPAATVTRSILTEPDNGVSQLYTLVNNAQSSIDMTIYDLIDTTMSGDLVAACNRGVRVRVILDVNDEKKANTPAYTQINAAPANCTAVWAWTKYPATHQKSFIVDGSELALLTLNLNTSDYANTRDFAILTNDANDIAAVETTFNADFTSTAVTPPTGTDLIWSPTTAQTSLVNMIDNATSSLLVENEEMSAKNIVTALENACMRGVTANITLTNQTEYQANFAALEAAGCGVHVYKDSTKVLYIHAKVIVADYNTTAVTAYMGSINFSTASMVENRELGTYVSDATLLQTLYNTLASDYAGAPAY